MYSLHCFSSWARFLTWLMSEAKVSVPSRICQHWLTKDWSSSGKLLTIEAVEEACGERLRLRQYSGQFANDEQAQSMSEILKESDPPLHVSNLLLRQWYLPSMQFHAAGLKTSIPMQNTYVQYKTICRNTMICRHISMSFAQHWKHCTCAACSVFDC